MFSTSKSCIWENLLWRPYFAFLFYSEIRHKLIVDDKIEKSVLHILQVFKSALIFRFTCYVALHVHMLCYHLFIVFAFNSLSQVFCTSYKTICETVLFFKITKHVQLLFLFKYWSDCECLLLMAEHIFNEKPFYLFICNYFIHIHIVMSP